LASERLFSAFAVGHQVNGQAQERRKNHQSGEHVLNLRIGTRAFVQRGKGRDCAAHEVSGVELASHNIQVNAIAPGGVETDMTTAVRNSPMNDEILARTPAKRWGRSDEIIGAAVFLASRGADFITGVTLPVDGGYSVY
jgi:hypothetical protein